MIRPSWSVDAFASGALECADRYESSQTTLDAGRPVVVSKMWQVIGDAAMIDGDGSLFEIWMIVSDSQKLPTGKRKRHQQAERSRKEENKRICHSNDGIDSDSDDHYQLSRTH